MPVGQSHQRRNIARAAFRSFALGAGGFSSRSITSLLSRTESLIRSCSLITDSASRSTVRRMNVVISVCASAAARDHGLVGRPDPQSHSVVLNGWSRHDEILHVRIESVHRTFGGVKAARTSWESVARCKFAARVAICEDEFWQDLARVTEAPMPMSSFLSNGGTIWKLGGVVALLGVIVGVFSFPGILGRWLLGPRRARPGSDILMKMELELADAARGCTRTIECSRHDVCAGCAGSGWRRALLYRLAPSAGAVVRSSQYVDSSRSPPPALPARARDSR